MGTKEFAGQCGNGGAAVKGGNHSSQKSGGGSGGLSTADMRSIQPENAGNSRVFEASRIAQGGVSQADANSFDMVTGLSQTNGVSSKLNAANINSQKTVTASTNSGSGKQVSTREYSRFASQANKNLSAIYNKASNAQKNRWAQEVGATTRSNGRLVGKKANGASGTVRKIRADLNNRAAAIGRRAEAADRRRTSRSSGRTDATLDGLF